jgi:hypothetical protein
MKNINKYLVILFVCLLFAMHAFSQNEEISFEPMLELSTKKNSDETRSFKALLIGEGEESVPIINAEIVFYNILNNEKKEIGKAKTNDKGNAVLTIPANYKYEKSEGGSILVVAEYSGSDILTGCEAELNFIDLKLLMELNSIDSVNSIKISAHYLNEKDELIPVSETDILFFIDGLFSRLPIGDAFLEDGVCEFEFPNYLKGDHEGFLNIYAAFIDHDDYATVEKLSKAKWGTHRVNYEEPTRELWTSGAPLWMIITLSILLIGVWSHYVFAVIQIILIKKDSKKA